MADATLAGRSILILEDDYYQAEDARQGLEDAGAEVIGPFSEGDAAVLAASERRPDCAVMDLNLGTGASFTSIRDLLARGVPILLVTGYDTGMIPQDLADLPYLQKPTNPGQIVAKVRALCGRRAG